ncbi:S ribonuclease [Pyrus ussuriensis x Pyrus communis]|uniref:S ribonuclease n=1 Tax=Pyrus ussuriensis x Pyrus communis TaxID=2448454 RepID=A0A5N5GC69_9ROSA|nr:S ribonuclease [Pyrus ussuriensis x Pyrus communis]
MLGSFSVKSRHHVTCPEVFAEGIRDSPTVEDEHSRATLGKQPGKGSGQSVFSRKKKTKYIESGDTGALRQGNIWCPSFLSSNGPLISEDSVMRDATMATVVARNLLTPGDNRLLLRRSDELAVQEPLAFSVQCAGSVSNMRQRLLARTRQVESLTAEVENLRQEIRQLKRENRDLHMLANNYSMSMKRKLDQLQESEGRIQSDHQRWKGTIPAVKIEVMGTHSAPQQLRINITAMIGQLESEEQLSRDHWCSGEICQFLATGWKGYPEKFIFHRMT